MNSQSIHIETCLHPDVLGIIDCRIGCTIQENIWRVESDTLHHRFERCDITLAAIDCDDIIFFTLSMDEVICEHSPSTRDEDFLF